MAKILLVEDDPDMSEVLVHTLSTRGFTLQLASDGRTALDLLRVNKYDIIVLDWMMPGLSGTDVCRSLRSIGDKTPILMLTARTSDDDTECGLDAGADDYLTKPFENKVLAAHLRALLRRPPLCSEPTLRAGDIRFDPVSGKVSRAGVEVRLRPMVIKLLEFLLRHPNQLFTPEALLQRVWHDDSVATLETLRAHIKLLRRAIDVPTSAVFPSETEFLLDTSGDPSASVHCSSASRWAQKPGYVQRTASTRSHTAGSDRLPRGNQARSDQSSARTGRESLD